MLKNGFKKETKKVFFLIFKSRTSSKMIGFILLYLIHLENEHMDLRFGYLLTESLWGKGLGTELVNGLVNHRQELGNIKSISGGVEKDNIGSIKVLEKCGFHSSSQNNKTKEVIFFIKNHIK